MHPEQPNNPLHGITLKALVEDLVARHGWEGLGARVQIRCFTHNPTINSSLKFLRKTPWARTEVEQFYLEDHRRIERNRERNQRRAARREGRSDPDAGEAPSGSSETSR